MLRETSHTLVVRAPRGARQPPDGEWGELVWNRSQRLHNCNHGCCDHKCVYEGNAHSRLDPD